MTLALNSLRLWPRSLYGQLTLILFSGLIAAHAMSFVLMDRERAQSARGMMVYSVANDIATAVAILDRVTPVERKDWLGRLNRRNYRFMLDPIAAGMTLPPGATQDLAQELAASITRALDNKTPISASLPPDGAKRLQLRLQLADGAPLTIELTPTDIPLAIRIPLVLLLQLALLALVTGLAVRFVTRPLAHLAQAADTLGPDFRGNLLSEKGPLEVSRAAVAFNTMQRRIADTLAERMQILAAVSHDLQTPITRMRLRTDLMDDAALRDKLQSDLKAMQMLVEEGITYARSMHGVNETPSRIDLDTLLDSLVCDYQDAGHAIQLHGRCGQPLTTRPYALRRIVSNLVDNAIKFGQQVEICIDASTPHQVGIAVRDRGPGIPSSELATVLQPFTRLESSRNRDTGGTGLGLAIAQQLSIALGGCLVLANRDDGGLEARFVLPLTE
ncbi:MAG: ATP-binding protein [Pseudomonadota bacterium]